MATAFALLWAFWSGSPLEVGDEWIFRKDLQHSEALHAAAEAMEAGAIARASHKLQVARRIGDPCLAFDILNGFLRYVPGSCDDSSKFVQFVGQHKDYECAVVALTRGGAVVWPTRNRIDGGMAIYPDQSGRVFAVLVGDPDEESPARLPGDPWSKLVAQDWLAEMPDGGYRLAIHEVGRGFLKSTVELPCDPDYVSFSANSEYMCVVSRSGDVLVYEVSRGRLVAEIGSDHGVVNGLAVGASQPFGRPDGPVRVTNDGRAVAYVSANRAVYCITLLCDHRGESIEMKVDRLPDSGSTFLGVFFRDDRNLDIVTDQGVMTWSAGGSLRTIVNFGAEPVIGVVPNASRIGAITWIGLLGEETILAVDVGGRNRVLTSAVTERLPWLASKNPRVVPQFIPGTRRLVVVSTGAERDSATNDWLGPGEKTVSDAGADRTRLCVREIHSELRRPHVVSCKSSSSWCLDFDGQHMYFTDQASPLQRLDLATGLTEIVDARESARLLLLHGAPQGVSIIEGGRGRIAWTFATPGQFNVSQNGTLSEFTIGHPAQRSVGCPSPSGEYFAAMSNQSLLEVWSLKSKRKLLGRQLDCAPVCVDEVVSRRNCELLFTATSNRLAVRYGGVLSVFDCRSWRLVGTINVPWPTVNDSLSASADGALYVMVIWGHPGTTFLNDQEIRKEWGEFDYLTELRNADEEDQAFVLLVRPDSHGQARCKVLALRSDMDQWTYPALTRDGAHLLVTVGSRLEVYRTDKLLRLARFQMGTVGPVIVSDDGKWLICGSHGRLLVVPLFGQQAESSRGVLTPLGKVGIAAGGNGFNALP